MLFLINIFVRKKFIIGIKKENINRNAASA